MQESDSAVPYSRPRRRLRRALLALFLAISAVAIAAWGWGEQIASNMVRTKLHALVEERMNARLEMGALHYSYPFGVSVDAVSLITTPGPGEAAITIASFRKLQLQLAELPLGSRPLQIERIHVIEPTLHLVRSEAGFCGDQPLLRADRPHGGPAKPDRKLSDVLRLRYVQLDDARVEYDDQRKRGNVPLVWEKINIRVDAQPASDGSALDFDFSASTSDLASIVSQGHFDLDALLLELKQLTIKTTVAPRQSQSALPALVQRRLEQLGVAGSATLTLAARIPLTDLNATDAKATLEITDAQAAPRGWPRGIDDLDGTVTLDLGGGVITSRIGPLVARSGTSALSLQPIERVTFDIATRRWQASPIRGALAYAPIEPAPLPALRQHITVVVKAALTQQDAVDGVELNFDDTTATFEGNGGHDVTLAGSIGYRDGLFSLRPTAVTGLGGRIDLAGDYERSSKFGRGEMTLSNVDLTKLGGVLQPAAAKQHKGMLSGDFRGGISRGDKDTLRGSGRFRIAEGEFVSVPVLGAISRSLKLGEGLFNARNASGRFTIADRVAQFDRIAVSTSALRLRGQGDAHLDGKLNFSVYADAASNWEKNIKATKVPILSDIGGALAGGTQKVLGTVSKQFTHLRVGGTVREPTVTPVPVPLLTENIAKLFSSEE